MFKHAFVKKVSALTCAVLGMSGAAVFADGGEATGLGDPSIAIGSGSGVVAAGVGLDTEPGTININVPGTVVQALLYWSGEGLPAGDDTIDVEINGGSETRTGVLIGGPTLFFNFNGNDFYSSTYRDDITDLISSGDNELIVSGLDFGLGFAASGAGVMVIYDDGSTSEIELNDGQDLAFAFFGAPLDATVPVDYSYSSSPVERSGELTIFAASVGAGRPNIIRVIYDDGTTVDFDNPLSSNDGPLWDTVSLPLTIPANTMGLTVEGISFDDGTGVLPASLTLIAAAVDINPEPFCGDGTMDDGEECDDGNNEDGDGCSANCTIEPFCGDGNVDDGEECDDGNNEDGDGCSANCTIEPFCGDGTMDDGEECDDGNNEDGDGCDANCMIEPFCGDGNVDDGEECDDGNNEDGDGCSANCTIEPFCGDGTMDDGEECDDGNNEDGDGCDANCMIEPFCGDGNVDDGEECDDGNNEDGDGCDANCMIEPFCGDGNVDDGEECDDGNNEDGDGCSANCTNEEEFAGCTPGFWKQPHHAVYWQGYSPDELYDDVFMVTSSYGPTLLDALKTGGGGEKALGRHAVAALLNAANEDTNYLYSVDEVIAAVQEAYETGEFNAIKNMLAEQNELGCTAKVRKYDDDDDDKSSPKSLDSNATSAVPSGAACGALGMLWLPLSVLGIVGTRRITRA